MGGWSRARSRNIGSRRRSRRTYGRRGTGGEGSSETQRKLELGEELEQGVGPGAEQEGAEARRRVSKAEGGFEAGR